MKYTGEFGPSKTFYFEPDEQAPRGRYYDGAPISEHPSNDEIAGHWEFWVAMANAEQKEILQTQYDIGVAHEFAKAVKGKDPTTIVDTAIRWWGKYWPQDVRDFLSYTKLKRDTLAKAGGWDHSRKQKYQGAIPQRVKALVALAAPDLLMLDGNSESRFSKLFFALCEKALIGGN